MRGVKSLVPLQAGSEQACPGLLLAALVRCHSARRPSSPTPFVLGATGACTGSPAAFFQGAGSLQERAGEVGTGLEPASRSLMNTY